MTLRKIIIGISVLLILFAIAIGLTSINHPIILKWVTGSAKHHGKPIPATIYANGKLNNNIKVFYTDEENKYLLSLAEYKNSGRLKFINIDLNEKLLASPVATSKNDYDIIAGHLFQSETGGHFIPFNDNIKGFNFDPNFTFTNRDIQFSLPSNIIKLDSVRIILP